jgi:hypothetical protein
VEEWWRELTYESKDAMTKKLIVSSDAVQTGQRTIWYEHFGGFEG